MNSSVAPTPTRRVVARRHYPQRFTSRVHAHGAFTSAVRLAEDAGVSSPYTFASRLHPEVEGTASEAEEEILTWTRVHSRLGITGHECGGGVMEIVRPTWHF